MCWKQSSCTFPLVLPHASIKLQSINELLFNIPNVTFAYVFAGLLKREKPQLEKEQGEKKNQTACDSEG